MSSLMHMAWMSTVCGRIKSDYRYSSSIVYNNFAWPNPTPQQRARVEEKAQAVLTARAPHLPPRGMSYLFAHSHGNVVAGEALRKAALDGLGQLVNSYIACQAAVPVHCYDPSQPTPSDFFDTWRTVNSIPLYPTGPDTPNIYPNWLATASGAVSGGMGNFFNVNDYALSHLIWETDEAFKPDSTAGISPPYGYSGSPDDNPAQQYGFTKNGVTGYTSSGRPITGNVPLNLGTPANLADRYEILAFAAEPRCMALGRTPNAAGFNSQPLGLGIWTYDPYPGHDYSTHPWHSGEFNFDTVMQLNWWGTLLNTFHITH